MRILLVTHRYPPDMGGIEAMSRLLAHGFVARGAEVTVVTHTPQPEVALNGPRVVGQPSARQLIDAYRNADVVFHNNICLRLLWPWLLFRRPLVVAVRTWVRRNSGRRGPRDWMKLAVLGRAKVVVSNSDASARDLPVRSIVIPNSYDDDVFFALPGTVRDTNLAFVGRLNPAKGADLLLRSFRELQLRHPGLSLVVIGDGPSRGDLTELARSLSVTNVRFTGSLDPVSVAAELRKADVLAVPSRWDEPFGIVALEGIASGCIVVASNGGGLPQAVGEAGLLFRADSLEALTEKLEEALFDPQTRARLRSQSGSHASAHRRAVMVDRYYSVLAASAGSS